MAIENNLPVIFDTATQTEDGLMSYQDKIKLDKMGENLDNKLSKDDLIPSSQLDISSDEAKIQPENLSDAVKQMMTGQAEVSMSVNKNSVSGEHIINNSITIDELDKRMFLANIVSSRPLNFAFDTKTVSINIPKGTLLLTDAITDRPLVTGIETDDVVMNINYPSDFDGLNFIVSPASGGTLSMINHRNANTISSTSSIIALITLSNTYEASVIMNGNCTVNGLANGVGTESAALTGTGRIVFDAESGIIDFTEANVLNLFIGGILNNTIQNQASIRLADYAEDIAYTLYWDGATRSLKAEASVIGNTDISKIALIKDGRIIPYVNTGIYYSKPYLEALYFTETIDQIDNIYISSDSKINILNKEENKIEISENTYVCFNKKAILVKNQECYYIDREGLHYIQFDLDNHTISTRYNSEPIDTTVRNIIIGTIWVGNGFVIPSGNFEYTIDGKTPYQQDLESAENNINELKNAITSDLDSNKILCTDELYMINGRELPIYESSMLLNTVEGIKPAILYNKNGNVFTPRTEFFNGDIQLDETINDNISLFAYDKYNTHSYLKKNVVLNKVNSDNKMGHTPKVLCIGDDLINDKTAYYIENILSELGVNVKMIGTMLNSQVYGEGRDGWFYSTFVGASGRGLNEGKINPQTAKGESTILLNPFVRIANADDKANKPNDCYRATGAYVEKNYYNDSSKDGSFYIFDFANYMEVQGIENPTMIIIAIKPELVNVFTEDIVSTNMIYMKQLIAGIREALPSVTIALVPQYGLSTEYDEMWNITSEMVEETVKYVADSNDANLKIIPSWLHMNREFGTENDKLSETAKIELANSIVSFILNI